MPGQEATNIQDTTKSTQIEVADLNELLGTPGAENITIEGDNKPSFFSKEKIDMNFINKKEDVVKTKTKEDDGGTQETPEAKVIREAAEAKAKEDAIKNKETVGKGAELVEEIIAEIEEVIVKDPDTGEPVKKENESGRPKLSKDAAMELTKKLLEKKLLVPFDDEKPIEEYTMKDYEELYEENFKSIEDSIREKVPVEFFDALPEELQVAAKYAADGGTDMKGLFKILAETEEIRDLKADDPKDQEVIAREYLKATNFGSLEEIDEQITEWKDLNKLAEKTSKFKPKLDGMHANMVAQKLAKQEEMRKRQAAAAKQYTDNVYTVLEKGDLGGVKLDKKTQGMLYSGLVQPNYPSVSGKPTNMLGHLLEKYQYVEPNHALIAEALWLLADPEGYRAKIKSAGGVESVEKTVRQLKTEEAKKSGSSAEIEKDETKKRTVKRNDNFFKR